MIEWNEIFNKIEIIIVLVVTGSATNAQQNSYVTPRMTITKNLKLTHPLALLFCVFISVHINLYSNQ